MASALVPREPEPSADPAAVAFEALREEVALLRRAVGGLAAERAAIEIPDYSETLGQIAGACAAAASKLKTLAQLPILHAETRDWANAIENASESVRRADRDALTNIHQQLRQVAADLSARLQSARAADSQRDWLLSAFLGGALAGMLLWVVALGPAVRAIL